MKRKTVYLIIVHILAIIGLIGFLTSCAKSKDVIYNSPRQERLQIKDSLKHERKLIKFDNRVDIRERKDERKEQKKRDKFVIDSMKRAYNFELRNRKLENDSLRNVVRQSKVNVKQSKADTKQYKAETKRVKVENKPQKKRNNWITALWIVLGIVLSLLAIVLVLVFRRRH